MAGFDFVTAAALFKGEIVLWSGPHLGVTSDPTVFRNARHLRRFRRNERWLGDLGYVGVGGVVTKFKRREWYGDFRIR